VKKWVVTGGLLILSALVCIVASLGVLLATTGGLKLAIRMADQFLPGQFSVESVQGRLVDHFVLEGFNYVDGSDVVSIDRVALSWNPASLWRKELAIESLLLKGVSLVVPAGDADDPGSEDTSFPSFALPIAITMENGAIETLVVITSEDTPIFQLSSLVAEDFSGKGSMIRVANFAVTAEQYRIGARGQLQTGEVYTARLDVDYSFNSDGLPIVSGKGVLNGSLDELAYEAYIVTPFAATAKGIVSDLDGDLNWQGRADDVAVHTQFQGCHLRGRISRGPRGIGVPGYGNQGEKDKNGNEK